MDVIVNRDWTRSPFYMLLNIVQIAVMQVFLESLKPV